ncbi:MAG: hypothetical protein ACR5K9_03090 [Wolbachia sp.]
MIFLAACPLLIAALCHFQVKRECFFFLSTELVNVKFYVKNRKPVSSTGMTGEGLLG